MTIKSKGKCNKCGTEVSEILQFKILKWCIDNNVKNYFMSRKCWYCGHDYVELVAKIK